MILQSSCEDGISSIVVLYPPPSGSYPPPSGSDYERAFILDFDFDRWLLFSTPMTMITMRESHNEPFFCGNNLHTSKVQSLSLGYIRWN